MGSGAPGREQQARTWRQLADGTASQASSPGPTATPAVGDRRPHFVCVCVGGVGARIGSLRIGQRLGPCSYGRGAGCHPGCVVLKRFLTEKPGGLARAGLGGGSGGGPEPSGQGGPAGSGRGPRKPWEHAAQEAGACVRGPAAGFMCKHEAPQQRAEAHLEQWVSVIRKDRRGTGAKSQAGLGASQGSTGEACRGRGLHNSVLNATELCT